MTTTVLIIIRLCFSNGDTIILRSAFFIHVWSYRLVLAKYIYVNYRFQFVFFKTLILCLDTSLTVTAAKVNTLETDEMP